MKSKYKMTGCARLLIFLVLFLPVVYIGVSYYQGNDPIAQIKEYFPSADNKNVPSEKKPYISRERYGISDEADTKIKSKDKEIENLKSQVRDLQKKIRELKSQSHDH